MISNAQRQGTRIRRRTKTFFFSRSYSLVRMARSAMVLLTHSSNPHSSFSGMTAYVRISVPLNWSAGRIKKS